MANPLPVSTQPPATGRTEARGAATDLAQGRDPLQRHALRDSLRPTLERSAVGLGRPSRASGGGGAVLQRLEDEDVTSKEDKKTLAGLKAIYSKALGYGGTYYEYVEESFDYYFEQASSLANLKVRIDAAILKAQTKAAAKKAETQSTPALSSSTPVPQPSTPVPQPSTPVPQPSTPVPQPSTGKKKGKGIDITASMLSSSSSYVPKASIDNRATSNAQIQQWIAQKPMGASVAYGGLYVSVDTVYIYATVTLATVGLNIPTHQVEVHYHPVPNTANYLHVKRSAAADAGNIVGKNNWLIPGGTATLAAADAAWDAAYPGNPSQKPWV